LSGLVNKFDKGKYVVIRRT